MVAAIKQTVIVQAGGIVEVRSSDLKEGTTAEVIVLLESPARSEHRTLSSFIGSAKWSDFIGSVAGQFKSTEEVDAYIRELRDEWDH